MALQITQTSTNKKPLRNWDPQDTVIIEAADNTAFTVHKAHACYYSPTFKTAFNSRFIEGETQTYAFDDVDASVIRLLIYWFYNQELVIDFTKATRSRTDQDLIELWILADRLFIPSLQNCAIRALEKVHKKCRTISTSCLKLVYDKTGPDSPLRALFLNWCAYNMANSRFSDRPDHFPQEMLIDLVQMLSLALPEKVASLKAAEARDMSQYEVEEDEDE